MTVASDETRELGRLRLGAQLELIELRDALAMDANAAAECAANEPDAWQRYAFQAQYAVLRARVNAIDEAMSHTKQAPGLDSALKEILKQIEVRSRGPAVATMVITLRLLETSPYDSLPELWKQALRDVAVPQLVEGLPTRPPRKDLDQYICRTIERADTRRKLEGPVSAAVAIVAFLRQKDRRTIWRAWEAFTPPDGMDVPTTIPHGQMPRSH